MVGGYIAGYAHKELIKKLGLEIELVVMVDQKIYEYREELLKIFDRVELIDLLEIRLNKEYYYAHKYSEWMKYSITKWHILKYEEYNKILFIDVDILPVEENFYKIFEIRTPGLGNKSFLESNRKIELSELSNKTSYKKEEYYKASKNFKKGLDGGILLIKPEKRLFDEYIEFIKVCEGRSGYISSLISGADETTLLLFLGYYKKMDLYTISNQYAVILWDQPYIKEIDGINYLSLIKPWLKMPLICWPEEYLYHKLGKKSLKKSKIITNIYLFYLLEEIVNFNNYIKRNLHKKNSPYNLEIIDNPELKRVSEPLLKEIENKFNKFKKDKNINYEYFNNLSQKDYEKFQEDFKKAKEINSLMKKKTLVDMKKFDINMFIK
jgi:hypothetical protein